MTDRRAPNNSINLEQLIEKLKKKSLTFEEIEDICHNKYPVINYEDLKNVNSLYALNLEQGIILYCPVESLTSGHYMCLYKRGCILNIFDPCGYTLSQDFKLMTYVRERNQEMYLTRLIQDWINKGGKISTNNYHLEKNSASINTCGLHCITRLSFKDYTDNEYWKFLKLGKYTPDDIVCLLNVLDALDMK